MYDVTGNAKIKVISDNQKPRQAAFIVTTSASYSISNVALFTADCNKILLVHHLVPNIQDGGRNRKHK